jgi:hypothetical protein
MNEIFTWILVVLAFAYFLWLIVFGLHLHDDGDDHGA